MLLTKSTTFILGPIASVLGYIMNAIFSFLSLLTIQNIGLTIILFTFIIYMLMMPLTIKQQKFSKLSAKMNPELQAIQKKYKDKKDQASMMKMNEETQAVYGKYGVSPMGSCLQLLIQMPILFALYKVIWNVPAYVTQVKDAFIPLVDKLAGNSAAQTFLNDYAAQAQVNFEKMGFTADSIVDVLYKFKPENWTALSSQFPDLSSVIGSVQGQVDHMNYFLGLNIADSPFSIIQSGMASGAILLVIGALLVPVLAGVTQWLNTKLIPQADTGNQNSGTMGNTMKTMNTVMPIMSAVFCFTLPVGMGLYWIAGAVIRSVQQVIVNKHMDKVDVDELVKKNLDKVNKKRAKQGLPPQKITNQAKTNVKNIQNPQNSQKKQITAEERAKTIEKSTEYYKSGSAKPGSIASKARMVEQFNEKNKKK